MNLDSLKDCTQKDLAALAKKRGVAGWHGMRKDQLVRALARLAKVKRDKSKLARRPAAAKATLNGSKSHSGRLNGKKLVSPIANGHKLNGHKSAAAKLKPNPNGHKPTVAKLKASSHGQQSAAAKRKPSGMKLGANGHKPAPFKSNGHKPSSASPIVRRQTAPAAVIKHPASRPAVPRPKSAVVVEKINKANSDREHLKDLARTNGKIDARRGPHKDRIVLLVRDSYWLHACWEITRNSIQRAKAAMAEHWHTARPVLRLLEVGDGATTSSAERVARDIEIHGGVQNWYIDVNDPPKHYRVSIGYLSPGGKFYSLARSNSITTPSPGSADDLDKNWSEVAENYEKIYALSGGYAEDGASGDLQELFEERLRRPMGAPIVARYGVGAERLLNRQREFLFEVDAEMIVYGQTKTDAYVTIAGEPVKIRPDGTFTVRVNMPDKRQVLPVVASSGDGIEQRTVVLAVERNTKVMEPMIRDGNE